MPNIEIKHLFKVNRFPDNDYKILFLILYTPVGCILLLLRLVIVVGVLICGYTLADSPKVQKLLSKLSCLAFGVSVTVENPKVRENVDVYISNSVSVLDHLAVHIATGSVSPGSKNALIKSKGFGSCYFGSQVNIENFKKNISLWVSENKMPVYFTPEGKITNGKAILKFKSWPFQISSKVQPLCITIERPFLDISVNVLGSTYLNDILFYMFSPFTNYKIKFLTPMEKKDQTDEEFIEIVRQNVAKSLKIETSNFTASDLNEWEKRTLAETRTENQVNRTRSVSPELQRMSMQVKEVLPHVPLNAIYNDLATTKSVDTTITNILEGRVHFVTETVPSASSSSPSSSRSSPSGSANSSPSFTTNTAGHMFNTAASSFGKNATDRSKSYQERKDQLIASARRRYIEKHNLDIPF